MILVMSTKTVFTTGEAAKICKVSQQTIIRCFDNGSLKGFRVPGSRFRRIPRDQLYSFMRDNGIPTDALESGKKKLLIVDDDQDLVELISEGFSRDGRFDIRSVNNGFDAGMGVREFRPDLVILDVMLPDINGKEVCQRSPQRFGARHGQDPLHLRDGRTRQSRRVEGSRRRRFHAEAVCHRRSDRPLLRFAGHRTQRHLLSAQRFLSDIAPAIAADGQSAALRWLPCVRYRSDRWWLPLSRQAADVLAAALLRDPGDARRVAAIEERLRVDPPLLIFTVLATTAADDSPPQSQSIVELAEKLSLQLSSLLASGDSCLGTPHTRRAESKEATPENLLATWTELHQRFLKLPRSQWLIAAGDWLELTGPAVPAAWQQSWPRVVDDASIPAEPQSADACYAPSELDLVTLARRIRRSQSLEDRFQVTLCQARRSALKQFAYGLSHEINNPLANISTRADTAP